MMGVKANIRRIIEEYKMNLIVKLFAVLLLASLPIHALGDSKSATKQKSSQSKKIGETPPSLIEIKGITIGMPIQDYKIIIANNGDGFFSIGGATGKSPSPPLYKIRDGKLDSFYFIFEPNDFPRVMEAVHNKYPGLNCTNKEIQNRMGATFNQVECALNGTNSLLNLSKYADDVETSMLMITSYEYLNELKKKSTKDSGDI